MYHGPVTRSQTAIKELAEAYFQQGFGAIPDYEMELLRNNPSRVQALMNQIIQRRQQPHQVVTRSRTTLEELAKHYLAQGFEQIPQEELRMLGANATLVQRLIDQIAELKQIHETLSLRPYVSHDPIIGHLVGYQYQKLMNEFRTLAHQQSMGGKKRFRKSHKNTKNYKKIKLKKSKKAMQRKGKKTYKKLRSKS